MRLVAVSKNAQGGGTHWALEAGYIRLKGDIVFKSPISSGRG